MMYSNLNSPSASSLCNNDEVVPRKYLPVGFTLGVNDVYCGRGGQCFNHTGNIRFRNIVSQHLKRYSNGVTKFDKSKIISDVVE